MLLEFLLELRGQNSRLRPAGREVNQALIEEKVITAFGKTCPHLDESQFAGFRRHLAFLSRNGSTRKRSREKQAENRTRHMRIMTKKGGSVLGPKQPSFLFAFIRVHSRLENESIQHAHELGNDAVFLFVRI